MPVTDDLDTSQQLTAIAGLLATGILRRRRATVTESSAISADTPPQALATPEKTVLSVSTRVNPPESSHTNGDAHAEH